MACLYRRVERFDKPNESEMASNSLEAEREWVRDGMAAGPRVQWIICR